MLKLVLISPSGSIFKDDKLQEDIVSQLAYVIKDLNENGIKFAVWSNRYFCLKEDRSKDIASILSEKSGVEVRYIHAGNGLFLARQKSGSVNKILEEYNVSVNEVILVGAHKEDMQAGVNNKLLLLRSSWYEKEIDYGFEVDSIQKLHRFCKIFGTRKNMFFWEVSDENIGLRYNSIGPFSTKKSEYEYFGSDALKAAKFDAGTKEFWSLLTISTLYFSGLTQLIDIITVYPGHSKNQPEKYYYEHIDLLSKCFNIPFSNNILIRHTESIKSTGVSASNRKFSTQLRTIAFNNNYSKYKKPPAKKYKPIRGETVLVIDDICTSGKSLESARQHIQNEGASVILFSWLKTINTKYTAISPNIDIKDYLKLSLNIEPSSVDYDYNLNIKNNSVSIDIDNCLRIFQKWIV